MKKDFFTESIHYQILYFIEEGKDRRKGKDRRFCLGEEFIHFLATLAILKIKYIIFLRIILVQFIQFLKSKEMNKFVSQTEATTFAFSSMPPSMLYRSSQLAYPT